MSTLLPSFFNEKDAGIFQGPDPSNKAPCSEPKDKRNPSNPLSDIDTSFSSIPDANPGGFQRKSRTVPDDEKDTDSLALFACSREFAHVALFGVEARQDVVLATLKNWNDLMIKTQKCCQFYKPAMQYITQRQKLAEKDWQKNKAATGLKCTKMPGVEVAILDDPVSVVAWAKVSAETGFNPKPEEPADPRVMDYIGYLNQWDERIVLKVIKELIAASNILEAVVINTMHGDPLSCRYARWVMGKLISSTPIPDSPSQPPHPNQTTDVGGSVRSEGDDTPVRSVKKEKQKSSAAGTNTQGGKKRSPRPVNQYPSVSKASAMLGLDLPTCVTHEAIIYQKEIGRRTDRVVQALLDRYKDLAFMSFWNPYLETRDSLVGLFLDGLNEAEVLRKLQDDQTLSPEHGRSNKRKRESKE